MQLGEYISIYIFVLNIFLAVTVFFSFLINIVQPITCFTVFGAVHFLMRIVFVTSVTNQRRQFKYHHFSHF